MSNRKGLVNKPKRVHAYANCDKPDACWYDEPYGLTVCWSVNGETQSGVIKTRELRALVKRLDAREAPAR